MTRLGAADFRAIDKRRWAVDPAHGHVTDVGWWGDRSRLSIRSSPERRVSWRSAPVARPARDRWERASIAGALLGGGPAWSPGSRAPGPGKPAPDARPTWPRWAELVRFRRQPGQRCLLRCHGPGGSARPTPEWGGSDCPGTAQNDRRRTPRTQRRGHVPRPGFESSTCRPSLFAILSDMMRLLGGIGKGRTSHAPMIFRARIPMKLRCGVRNRDFRL